jgi:hypothetical protein
VELARDPRALLDEGRLGVGLLALETLLAQASLPDQPTGYPRSTEHEREEDDARDVDPVPVGRHRLDVEHEGQRARHERAAAARVRSRAVDRQQHEQADRLAVPESLRECRAHGREHRKQSEQEERRAHAPSGSRAQCDHASRGREPRADRFVQEQDLHEGDRSDSGGERLVAASLHERGQLFQHSHQAYGLTAARSIGRESDLGAKKITLESDRRSPAAATTVEAAPSTVETSTNLEVHRYSSPP